MGGADFGTVEMFQLKTDLDTIAFAQHTEKGDRIPQIIKILGSDITGAMAIHGQE